MGICFLVIGELLILLSYIQPRHSRDICATSVREDGNLLVTHIHNHMLFVPNRHSPAYSRHIRPHCQGSTWLCPK